MMERASARYSLIPFGFAQGGRLAFGSWETVGEVKTLQVCQTCQVWDRKFAVPRPPRGHTRGRGKV